MFDKCIACTRMGESCVPNLMLLPFAELMKWCAKRQKHLGWTDQDLADRSKVPIGTIKRIKAGEYLDCKYSTIKYLLIALIGGTTDEFACELLQTEKLSAVEKENIELKSKLDAIDEQHRKDIRAIKEEYQEQITFLKEQLKAWQAIGEKKGL